MTDSERATPTLYTVQLTLLSFLNGLDDIRLFYLAGISILGGDNLESLGQNNPQNVK